MVATLDVLDVALYAVAGAVAAFGFGALIVVVSREWSLRETAEAARKYLDTSSKTKDARASWKLEDTIELLDTAGQLPISRLDARYKEVLVRARGEREAEPNQTQDAKPGEARIDNDELARDEQRVESVRRDISREDVLRKQRLLKALAAEHPFRLRRKQPE